MLNKILGHYHYKSSFGANNMTSVPWFSGWCHWMCCDNVDCWQKTTSRPVLLPATCSCSCTQLTQCRQIWTGAVRQADAATLRLQHGSCLWSISFKLLTRFRRQWAFPWDTVSLSALLQQLESSWLLKALHTSQINPADNFAETGRNVKLVRWDKSSTTWWGWWKQ